MPDRCVVAGCSNIPNSEKGIALHKISFYGDDRNKVKARRKKWTEFVQLKRAKWSPTASSVVCSCQFLPEILQFCSLQYIFECTPLLCGSFRIHLAMVFTL